jgi:hypothetical protein
MKPLAIALSGSVRGSWGEGDDGGNLANVQCKAIQNCHNESPLYNEYMLIKVKKISTFSIQLQCGTQVSHIFRGESLSPIE